VFHPYGIDKIRRGRRLCPRAATGFLLSCGVEHVFSLHEVLHYRTAARKSFVNTRVCESPPEVLRRSATYLISRTTPAGSRNESWTLTWDEVISPLATLFNARSRTSVPTNSLQALQKDNLAGRFIVPKRRSLATTRLLRRLRDALKNLARDLAALVGAAQGLCTNGIG